MAIGVLRARVIAAAPLWSLAAALAYVVSPLNFWILFRHTDWLDTYTDRTDLALAAAPALGLLAIGAAAALAIGRERAIAAAWAGPLAKAIWLFTAMGILSGIYGITRHNSPELVLSDFLPIAELFGFFFLAVNAVRSEADARIVGVGIVASLAATILIRIYFFIPAVDTLPQLAAGFTHGLPGTGVTALFVIGRVMPRLPLLQAAAWIVPFALGYAISGSSARLRLTAAIASGLSIVAVYLSFERGLWLFAAVGVAFVLVEGLRSTRFRWPAARSAVAGVTIALAAYTAIAVVIRAEPSTTALDRLGYTFVQVNSNVPLAHKRQDETAGITQVLSSYSRPRSAFQLVVGGGLGATYIGPTGILETTYEAQAHEVKHYTFDTYLGTVLRMGVIGEIGLGIWVAIFLAYGLASWWRGQNRVIRMLGAASIGALLGVALMSFVDPYLLAHPITIFEGVLAAALVRVAPRMPWHRKGAI